MQKIVLVALLGASVFAVPAFAQVYPGAPNASAQAGAAAPDTHATAGAGTATQAGTSSGASTQPLGLGGLLKQTQANPSDPAADTASDGAGPTGSLDAKTRAKLHAHGH